MGKLTDFNAQLAAVMAERPEAPPAEPMEVSAQADFAPILAALEAIAERIEPSPTPDAIDLKPHVEALIRGLKPVKDKPLDLTPLVKALEGIQFPDIPEMVWPEQSPYTFDIQRDNDGNMQRVIATPGAPKEAPAEPLDVE